MAEDGDGRRPYGPGSEGPLADPVEMPPCHPIKGHLASMTYHRPDSVAYAALVPGVWFVSPSAAESAGFELAKAHPEPGATEDFEPGGARHPCTTEAVAALLGAAPPPQPVAPPTLESATGAEPLDVESIFEQWIELVEDRDEDETTSSRRASPGHCSSRRTPTPPSGSMRRGARGGPTYCSPWSWSYRSPP